MASLKSRIVQGLIRNRHFLKGQFKKETMEFSETAVLAFRETCEKGAKRFGNLPKGISVKPELINMVFSEWIIPQNTNTEKLIFYVHGGGYVSGSCNDHRAIVAKLAQQSKLTHLLYEYGLAPESPYPAALNDSLNVYKAVLEKGYDPNNIIVMGESAGGGLCLSLLLALRDRKLPLPKAAVAIQPWTDLTCSGASYQTKNKVSVAPYNCWNVFSHYYVGTSNAKDPGISPLFGELSGLPPIFINVGDSDELYSDSVNFYEKAKEAGVNIQLREGKGMIHCYPLLAPLFPEASEALNESIDFIHGQLNS